MKYYKFILIILVIFLKTGNVLSNTNIFNVNNIEIVNNIKTSNAILADQAIKKGFKELVDKILLKDDTKKLKELKFSDIKKLVAYYQVSNRSENNNGVEKINYNISFDKDKIYALFYKRNISYSEITNKELFILPILKKKNKFFIYNQNFFYNKWNEVHATELIEFILPLENIEIIQKVNLNKDNLLNLDLSSLLVEYSGKNLALVLIEDNNFKEEKVYFKVEILGKNIVKNIQIKRLNLDEEEFYKKIITEVKQEIINLIKSQNLIDIRLPSFLNAQLKISKNSNLVQLKSRLKKIDLIENIYIQEFNKESVFLKIKYFGKLNKILKQLEEQKIIFTLINEQWSIKII
jgi:hypothetical protein